MADPTQEEASHGDMDHGLGDIDALLVVAHQPAPAVFRGVRLTLWSPGLSRALRRRGPSAWSASPLTGLLSVRHRKEAG